MKKFDLPERPPGLLDGLLNEVLKNWPGAVQGHEAAKADLYVALLTICRILARQRLRVRPLSGDWRQDSDDVASDVAMEQWKRIHEDRWSYDAGRSKLSTYLAVCVENRICSIGRRNRPLVLDMEGQLDVHGHRKWLRMRNAGNQALTAPQLCPQADQVVDMWLAGNSLPVIRRQLGLQRSDLRAVMSGCGSRHLLQAL